RPAHRQALVAGDGGGVGRRPRGDHSDHRRHGTDLGRTRIPLQPATLGAVVGTARDRPDVGRPPRTRRAEHTPLLLALRAVWPELPSAARRSAQFGDTRAIRAMDERHPVATARVGVRVFAGDRAGLRVPGAAVWGVGWRCGGRVVAPDAARLWRRPHRGDRYTGSAALAGGRARILERLARAERARLAGRGRNPGRPG